MGDPTFHDKFPECKMGPEKQHEAFAMALGCCDSRAEQGQISQIVPGSMLGGFKPV